ncbi:MAG TPA: peptidoglycan-binding domain-containing protein [Chthoniobacterales bacterium]
MKHALFLLVASVCLGSISSKAESDSALFFYDPHGDPLAARDDYGLRHQMPATNRTDFAPRAPFRFCYYFKSGAVIAADPAYVGALQDALQRNGYYCGPIDGVLSDAVRDAIARLQKNCSQHVTGTLTLGVRRALHLP